MAKIGRLQLAGPAETVGAAGTLTLVTVAEVQAYIEKPAEAAFDALLQILIDSACTGAFGIMGGRFLKRPATAFDFVLTPETEEVLFLPQYPIGTVSAVEAGYMSANNVWTATHVFASTDYYAESRSGRLYSQWPSDRHSVRVTWTGGHVTPPSDAKDAVMQWVGVKLQRLRKARWDVRSMSGPTESYSFEDELPQSAASILAKYAIPEASMAS